MDFLKTACVEPADLFINRKESKDRRGEQFDFFALSAFFAVNFGIQAKSGVEAPQEPPRKIQDNQSGPSSPLWLSCICGENFFYPSRNASDISANTRYTMRTMLSRLLITMCRTFTKAFFGLAFTACAALLVAGCSPSSQRAEDNTPADIRGKPINSPQPAPTQALAGAVPPVSTKVAPGNDSVTPQATVAQRASPSKSGDQAASPKDEVADSPTADFLSVSFDKLASFNFEIPDEQPPTNSVAQPSQSKDQIPAAVKALDQRKVALKGFMLPLRVESGLVTEMLIMRDQSMCCYGTVPKINEWVSVKMTEKGVKAIMDQPVTIFGKLRVGEMRENGYLVGIYAMEGEKMAGPLDL